MSVNIENVEWNYKSKRHAFSPYIEEFLRDKKNGVRGTGQSVSNKTIEAYRSGLRTLERFLGKPLEDATEHEIEEAVIEVKAEGNYSESTINHMATASRTFYTWALANHGDRFTVESNPFTSIHVNTSKYEKRPRPSINERTFKSILDAIETIMEQRLDEGMSQSTRTANTPWARDEARYDRLTLPLKLMFYGGLRISEAVNLMTKNVESDGVFVNGKGSNTRFVPLPKHIMDDLRTFMKDWGGSTYVFESPAPAMDGTYGHPISTRPVTVAFTSAVKHLHLDERIKPHALRHSFAKQAIDKIGRLDVVRDLLGHENINTTMLYINNTNEDLKEQAAKVWK